MCSVLLVLRLLIACVFTDFMNDRLPRFVYRLKQFDLLIRHSFYFLKHNQRYLYHGNFWAELTVKIICSVPWVPSLFLLSPNPPLWVVLLSSCILIVSCTRQRLIMFAFLGVFFCMLTVPSSCFSFPSHSAFLPSFFNTELVIVLFRLLLLLPSSSSNCCCCCFCFVFCGATLNNTAKLLNFMLV